MNMAIYQENDLLRLAMCMIQRLHDFGEFEHLLGDRRGQVYADSAYTHRAQVPTKTMTEKLGKDKQ